jgi:hypothetical protein
MSQAGELGEQSYFLRSRSLETNPTVALCTFMITPRLILLRMKNASEKKKVIEKIKTYFVFNNFFFENLAVYEIMLKIW